MNNVVVPEEIKFKKGKRYFTLSEIDMLLNAGVLLAGSCLPSDDDWNRLIGIYGYNGSKSMMKIVGLKLNGWVDAKDMAAYNADPEGFDGVRYAGDFGYYLSESTTRRGVLALGLGRDGYLDVDEASFDCGFSVRVLCH